MSDDDALPEPRHRATGRRPRRGVIVAVVAALVLVVVGTGFLWMRSGDSAPKAAPPPPITHAPRPTPTPTPTPTTPTPTPTPTPTIPHDVVAPAGPTKFEFKGPNFTIKAHVCAMADIRPLDPPGEQEHTVCWVYTDDGFGGNAPASNGKTTYILGHSWAENPREVLNPISVPATKEILAATPKYVTGTKTYPVKGLNGSMITLWTPKGKLQYKVRNVYGVVKSQAGYVKPLMDSSIKNRVVIITCAERNGVDYDYNIVLDAYLYSSQKVAKTG